MIFRDYDEVAVVNPDYDLEYYGETGWIFSVDTWNNDNCPYFVVFDRLSLGCIWCKSEDMVLVYREEITNESS